MADGSGMPTDWPVMMQEMQATLAASTEVLEESKRKPEEWKKEREEWKNEGEEWKREREEHNARIQKLEHAILGTAPEIRPALEDKESQEQPADDDHPWSGQDDIDNDEIIEKRKKKQPAVAATGRQINTYQDPAPMRRNLTLVSTDKAGPTRNKGHFGITKEETPRVAKTCTLGIMR